ncbi:MAG: nucleotidyltransferase domain-containing protein [Methanoregula sp.]
MTKTIHDLVSHDLSMVKAAVRHKVRQLSQVPGFDRVRFIILYGSSLTGQPGSDIDLCVYYDGDLPAASRFRILALSQPGQDLFDIQIFSALPLYVQGEVMKGEVVYAPDMRFVYDTAVMTYREFERFRHRLDDYTGEKAIT